MGMQDGVASVKSNRSLALAAESLRQPLHSRVRQLLRERILSSFQHGQRFYSERELIQELNVSQPTVRRALSDLANEGFLVPDPRRGFFVRHHSEQRSVGIIRPLRESLAPSEEFTSYFAACRELDCRFASHPLQQNDTIEDVFRSIQNKPSEERMLITGFTGEFTLELSSRLRAEGYRHVVVGPTIPGYVGKSLGWNHELEVEQIIDHLTELGHEEIVFMVNEPRTLLITSLRAEMVRRKLEEKRYAKCKLVFCETQSWDDSFEAAYRKTHEILKTKKRPTAIVPLSGVGAWAVLRYAVEHDIAVPDELSIVSFDPMTNAALLPVPMTELTFSQAERAMKAVSLLWSDDEGAQHHCIPSCLVVRKSTARRS